MSKSSGSKRTPEELHALRSATGKKGGNAPHVRRGRKPDLYHFPRVQISTKSIDHEVFKRYCKMTHMSICKLLHFAASYLLEKYPQIGKPDGWIE